METRCISCKREISKGQAQCFICGSKQSFFRYHFSAFMLFVFLFAILSAGAFWYFKKELALIEERNIATAALNEETAKLKIIQLEKQLQTAQQKIQQVGENSAQSGNALEQEKLKTEEALAKVIEVEKRAGWLNKENRRFKAEIKQLKEQIQSIEASNVAIISESNSAQINDQSEVNQLRNQKKNLNDKIAAIKSELEKRWNEESTASGVAPDALTLSQRAIELENATVIERQEILNLDAKIDELVKNLE